MFGLGEKGTFASFYFGWRCFFDRPFIFKEK